MVDEHCYKSPQWFWENLHRYDAYDRAKSKVYLGEWASFDNKRRSTVRAAISEAAYLTGLERNADVVRFASYAPLLAKHGHVHWSPNLIYFNNTEVFPTINYHVQQLFSLHNGDAYLTTTVDDSSKPASFAASSVRDSKTGDLILKLVNGSNAPKPLRVELTGARRLPATAMKTVLASPNANDDNERAVRPVTGSLAISPTFNYEAPANSLTVIRIKGR
jgi:alpha-L-arabinofuranosidase